MDFIYRLSGREAKDLNNQLVETQNLLNERITQHEAEQALSASWAKRVTTLEKAEKYYQEEINKLKNEAKFLNVKLETQKAIKEKAIKEVGEANLRIDTIKEELFKFQQELATKNGDINSMLETVSKLEQQIKQLQMPKVPQTQLGKKLQSIKSKK